MRNFVGIISGNAKAGCPMFVPYQWANVGNTLSLVVIMGYPPYFRKSMATKDLDRGALHIGRKSMNLKDLHRGARLRAIRREVKRSFQVVLKILWELFRIAPHPPSFRKSSATKELRAFRDFGLQVLGIIGLGGAGLLKLTGNRAEGRLYSKW
jgi:hypothetical protein